MCPEFRLAQFQVPDGHLWLIALYQTGELYTLMQRRLKIRHKKEKLWFSLTCRCVLKRFSLLVYSKLFLIRRYKVQRLHSWLSQSVTCSTLKPHGKMQHMFALPLKKTETKQQENINNYLKSHKTEINQLSSAYSILPKTISWVR